jgi:hypothetical protein
MTKFHRRQLYFPIPDIIPQPQHRRRLPPSTISDITLKFRGTGRRRRAKPGAGGRLLGIWRGRGSLLAVSLERLKIRFGMLEPVTGDVQLNVMML